MNGLIESVPQITQVPEIKVEYTNEFGDRSTFSTTLDYMTDVFGMQEAFCRFLLSAGWTWESVKKVHPEYTTEIKE